MTVVLSAQNLLLEYKIRRIFRRPETKRVLSGITFDLIQGECLGVIGRNGVGKSSLLRILAGIIAPDVGTVVTKAKKITLLNLQAGFILNP